jgi:hypothetical protein
MLEERVEGRSSVVAGSRTVRGLLGTSESRVEAAKHTETLSIDMAS